MSDDETKQGRLDVVRKALESEARLYRKLHDRKFEIACNFCHQLRSEVGKLIRGVSQDHRPIYICDACVRECVAVLEKQDEAKAEDGK